jgi:hypothetical protein
MKCTGVKVALLVFSSIVAGIVLFVLFGWLMLRQCGHCGPVDVEVTVRVPKDVPVASGDDLNLRVFGTESKKEMLFTKEGIPYAVKRGHRVPFGGRGVEMSPEQREYVIRRDGGSAQYLWVLAYIDENNNGLLDKGEPYGVYDGNPIRAGCSSKERLKKVSIVLDKERKLDD